jgi:hypothetical protein
MKQIPCMFPRSGLVDYLIGWVDEFVVFGKADESSGAVSPRACSPRVTRIRASAPHQDLQGGNQPDGARIDTGEVVDQPLGH